MRQSAGQLFRKFWFQPATARPLAAVRIWVSAILLIQYFLLRHSVFDFFSSQGFLQGELGQILNDPKLPQISWLVRGLEPLGISEFQIIFAVCLSYLGSLCLFFIGYKTRIFGLSVWLLHWFLLNSSDSTRYGLDVYTHVFLFYLACSPCGDAWSADSFKKTIQKPQIWARLSLRWMQLHLCLTYFLSGIEKAQGPQWRSGDILWRAMTLPIYRQYNLEWLAYWPHLSAAGTWLSLIFEIGYFIFIWPRSTRAIWVAGIVAMHLGIALFLGLTLFGLLMAGLTVCLFAVKADSVEGG